MKKLRFPLFLAVILLLTALLIACSQRETVSRKITFETNGGASVATRENEVPAFPISKKDGYRIEGWYYDNTLKDRVSFPMTATDDVTLYAKWVSVETGNEGISYVRNADNTGFIAKRYEDRSYSVCIPDTHMNLPVVAVDYGFFATRAYVGYIYIGKNVKEISESFNRCVSLKAFEVHGGNTVYKTESDALVKIDDNEVIAVPRNYSSDVFTLDKNLKTDALQYNDKIKSVVLEQNAFASPSAFFDLPSVQNFTVNASNGNFYAENGILYSKDKKILYKYPQGRTEREFIVPDYVETIGESAFYATVLHSITLGKNVRTYDDFSYAPYLEEIKVNENNVAYRSLGGALYSADKKILERVPCGKKGVFDVEKGTEEIAPYAFSYNESLTETTIPKSVKNIGAYAFMRCGELENVLFEEESELENIEGSAFSMCSSLKKLAVTSRRPPHTTPDLFDAVSTDFVLVLPSNADEIYKYYWNFAERYFSFTGIALTTYTVTYETNGGESVEAYHGVFVKKAPEPKKSGFVFNGWYDNDEFLGEKISFPFIIEDHVILYADFLPEGFI